MKKLQLLFLALFLLTTAQAQGLIINPETVLKPGMYKNFEEFKTNSPSLPFPAGYKIESREKPYGTVFGGKNHLDYLILVNSKLVKEKTPVYGFCDGTKVYLNPFTGDLSKTSKSFDQLTFLGRYCTYRSIKSDKGKPEVVRGGVTEGGNNKINIFALDMATGVVTELTKKTVRHFIASDVALSAEFKADKNSEDKLEEYLIRFSQAHPEII